MNIDDIARLAGVSKATVSRVINNKPHVSEKLRNRINQIIEEQGYQPNQVAQALNTKETKVVGVLLPTIGLDVFSDITIGIQDAFQKRGYDVLLLEYQGREQLLYEKINILQKKRVDGVILFPTMDVSKILNEVSLRIPVLTIGDDIGQSSVIVNDYESVYETIVQLNIMGYKDIGYVSMPKSHSVGSKRLEGYKKACEVLGIEERISYAKGLSYKDGLEATGILDKCDCILYAMDRLAIGGMRYCYEHGLKIPEEIGIVGIDDMAVSAHMTPSLSTIKYDYIDIGKTSGEMMINLIKNENISNIEVKHELILRESTKGGNNVR